MVRLAHEPDALTSDLGRSPTAGELAQRLHWRPEEILEASADHEIRRIAPDHPIFRIDPSTR